MLEVLQHSEISTGISSMLSSELLSKSAVAKTAVEKHMHARKQTTSDERSWIAIAVATLGLTLGSSLFPP